MALKMLTANRLCDGAVVYLTGAHEWSQRIDDGRIAETDAEEAELVAAGAEAVRLRLVVAPYVIEVERTASGLAPVRYKELIRAKGPTVPSGTPSRGW